ncbi:MAG TPA: nuclear transport factor 2 family protein [Longimicrobiales bacterium]
MKTLSILLLTLALAGNASAQATEADSSAIRQAALDYIEGYYTADAARMERALHPQLVKRIVRDVDGERRISEMTAQQLIDGTAAGWGARVPAEVRRTDVVILDVFRNVAVVRVDAHDWIDYMQLARFGDEWKIVNVLWELRQ